MNELTNQMNPSMYIWCNLCNSRPADGVLEILVEGEVDTRKLQVCTECVIKIPDDGWLNEKNLNSKPILTMEDFATESPENFPEFPDLE